LDAWWEGKKDWVEPACSFGKTSMPIMVAAVAAGSLVLPIAAAPAAAAAALAGLFALTDIGTYWGAEAFYWLFPPQTVQAGIAMVGAHDPNDIVGPAGIGTLNWIRTGDLLTYRIRFENDPSIATAPAQGVTITLPLDPDFDWSTFALGDFGFGDLTFAVSGGRQHDEALLEVSARVGVDVFYSAGLDAVNGLVTWTFLSVDPSTGRVPDDPFAGFLPPNLASPEGEGFVSFTVRSPDDVPTGTQVTAEATIVFDTEVPILTPEALNTFDAEGPTSAVAVRKTGLGCDILLALSGLDGAGSGVAEYDVYVQDAAGELAFWSTVTGAEAVFPGTWGERYRFHLVARDWVGHAEELSPVPQAAIATPEWAFRFGLAGTAVGELFVALDAAASEGWDEALDEDIAAASGVGRDGAEGTPVLLLGPPGHEALRYDVRPDSSADVRWTLRIGAGAAGAGEPLAEAVMLSWDPDAVPADREMWLVPLDTAGSPVLGSAVRLRQRSATSVAESGDWQVVLGDPPAVVHLARGWNLLSLPLDPVPPTVGDCFGAAVSRDIAWVWGHDGPGRGIEGLTPTMTLRCGQGFWVHALAPAVVEVPGFAPAAPSVTLVAGWNLIGVTRACRLPADVRLSAYAFRWVPGIPNGHYRVVTELDPGWGYWLHWDGPEATIVFPPR
jgi:hypothetical protein